MTSADSSGSFRIVRSSTVGANAVTRWLRENGLSPELGGWKASIRLVVAVQHVNELADPTRFEIELEPEMWALSFSHQGRTSRIRIAEIATVDGCDDHNLLVVTPQLRDLGRLLRQLERRHALRFHRDTAEVRTDYPLIKDAALRWISGL